MPRRLLFALLLASVSPVTGNLVRAKRSQGKSASRSPSMRLVAAHDNDGVAAGATVQLISQYPWYHTSEDLRSEAMRLAASCGGAVSVQTVNQSGVSVDVVKVRKPGTQPVNRVFMLFGEHSRELISPESGLHLLRVLCGDARPREGAPSADAVLRDSEFEMVLNGNPGSRPKVEGGDYCLRTNPRGIDLNRNWDEKFLREPDPTGNVERGQTYGGPEAFSEPETQIFRRLVTEYEPTAFVSVHSGTRGMYMPWAFDTEHLAERNQPQMLELLRTLDKTYCQCPFGAAGKEVGYSCAGTSLDWVYDKLQTPYAFAWEIYTSPAYARSLTTRWNAKAAAGAALLEKGHHLGHPRFVDLFQTHASDFVQVKHALDHQHALDKMSTDECFETFNPDTKELYDSTVANWAAAYMEMSQRIAGQLRGAQAANATAP
mmetsp:Transcript_8775/g.23494  ORF Transcript_8775/g.23494 Transcript_8775/m.23494 type:complete len:431 (+) Transcript_8775:76-1368(+)